MGFKCSGRLWPGGEGSWFCPVYASGHPQGKAVKGLAGEGTRLALLPLGQRSEVSISPNNARAMLSHGNTSMR